MNTSKFSEQMVRISVLQNLDKVLAQNGIDADAVLSKFDMNTRMIKGGELLTDVRNIGALLEHCVNITGCPDFPLQLAAAQDLSLIRALALLLQTASTLGDALQKASQYQNVHAQPVMWIQKDLGNTVSFDVFLDAEGLSPAQHQLSLDLSLAQAHRGIQALSQGRVHLNRVRLSTDRPVETKLSRRFFQAPIEYNSEVDGLILPASSLDMPLIHSDEHMHEALLQQISPSEVAVDETSLIQEVRGIIRSLLPMGDFSLERIARCYACDKRTLQRCLREEGNTAYQVLLDDVRFDLVQQYLRDSRMPMTQLTYLAGFTDSSNFARAFRKRFGMSPKHWREQYRGSSNTSRTRRLKLCQSPG